MARKFNPRSVVGKQTNIHFVVVTSFQLILLRFLIASCYLSPSCIFGLAEQDSSESSPPSNPEVKPIRNSDHHYLSDRIKDDIHLTTQPSVDDHTDNVRFYDEEFVDDDDHIKKEQQQSGVKNNNMHEESRIERIHPRSRGWYIKQEQPSGPAVDNDNHDDVSSKSSVCNNDGSQQKQLSSQDDVNMLITNDMSDRLDEKQQKPDDKPSPELNHLSTINAEETQPQIDRKLHEEIIAYYEEQIRKHQQEMLKLTHQQQNNLPTDEERQLSSSNIDKTSSYPIETDRIVDEERQLASETENSSSFPLVTDFEKEQERQVTYETIDSSPSLTNLKEHEVRIFSSENDNSFPAVINVIDHEERKPSSENDNSFPTFEYFDEQEEQQLKSQVDNSSPAFIKEQEKEQVASLPLGTNLSTEEFTVPENMDSLLETILEESKMTTEEETIIVQGNNAFDGPDIVEETTITGEESIIINNKDNDEKGFLSYQEQIRRIMDMEEMESHVDEVNDKIIAVEEYMTISLPDVTDKSNEVLSVSKDIKTPDETLSTDRMMIDSNDTLAVEDDRTLLDIFGEVAKDFLTQKMIKETDSGCDWDWRTLRCEPAFYCSFQYKLGDYHFGRSCRLRPRQQQRASNNNVTRISSIPSVASISTNETSTPFDDYDSILTASHSFREISIRDRIASLAKQTAEITIEKSKEVGSDIIRFTSKKQAALKQKYYAIRQRTCQNFWANTEALKKEEGKFVGLDASFCFSVELVPVPNLRQRLLCGPLPDFPVCEDDVSVVDDNKLGYDNSADEDPFNNVRPIQFRQQQSQPLRRQEPHQVNNMPNHPPILEKIRHEQRKVFSDID